VRSGVGHFCALARVGNKVAHPTNCGLEGIDE
jgi:hypothetical protein